mgnify:CR=1 FL=1
MTIIVDDDNVCECGAYFESTGYCVNGHLKIEEIPVHMVTLDDMLDDVRTLRAKVVEQAGLVKGTQERLQATREYQDNLDAQDMLRTTKGDLEHAEALLKVALQMHNENTGEKKGHGWQAKEFKTMEYPIEDALNWARQKPATANLVKLNKSTFEKAVRALVETGMAEDLEFITLGTETRIQLTKELG